MMKLLRRIFSTISKTIQGIIAALRFGWMSVLIILIIFFLSLLDQGQTVFIDLLDRNPINLILFFTIFGGLANIVSHYPIYNQKWFESRNGINEEDDIKWQIDTSNFYPWIRKILNLLNHILGWGFITYMEKKGPACIPPEIRGEKIMRRSFGVILYIALFFQLLKVDTDANVDDFVFFKWLAIAAIFYGLFLFIQLNSAKIKLPFMMVAFYCSLFLKGLVLASSFYLGWCSETFILFAITLLTDTIKFSMYRAYRTGNEMDKLEDLPVFLKIQDHNIYVALMSMSSWLCLITVFYANAYTMRVNTLVIILCYLNLIYGVFIVPLKLYLYHNTNQNTWSNRYGKTNIIKGIVYGPGIILTAVFIMIMMGLGIICGNDLHLLEPVKISTKSNVINLDSFKTNFEKQFNNEEYVYFISSYGGGLKANVWNMMLLDTLACFGEQKINILQKTAAISGVSGGSIGQALYASLYNEKSEKRRDTIIKDIACTDILSIDAAYFMGYDFIREQNIWTDKFNDDRAKHAMGVYSDLIDPNLSLDEISFYEYYWKLNRNGSYFPTIISNSAGTHIQRGVACTIDLRDSFSNVFPGAINILDDKLDGTSLSYLDAFSPTNRFPIFSPAAKIENKGHFLDGGYFENSGLLSLKDFHEFLKNNNLMEGKRPVFIQIFNSAPEFYLHHLESNGFDSLNKDINEASELLSIVSTVANIDHLPRYLVAQMSKDEDFNFIQLHLPYKMTEKKIAGVLKAKIDSEHQEKVQKMIAAVNDSIDSVLYRSKVKYNLSNYDHIEPPLARYLGEQSYNYMRAEIEFGEVFKELEKFIEKSQ